MWVHRLGAGLLAGLLFAGLSLLTLISTLIHPLLAILFLPLTVPVPWIWWRTDLQPLGAALRDHPGVCFPGQTRLIPNLLYPPLCLLILLAGISALAAAGYWSWQYVLALFAD
jgi:hypothetical protein